MVDPLETNEPNPIATVDEEEPTYPDTGICPKCNYVGIIQTSDCTGVEFTYQFLNGNWKEIDQNWYGDTTNTYKCPACKWDSNEIELGVMEDD